MLQQWNQISPTCLVILTIFNFIRSILYMHLSIALATPDYEFDTKKSTYIFRMIKAILYLWNISSDIYSVYYTAVYNTWLYRGFWTFGVCVHESVFYTVLRRPIIDFRDSKHLFIENAQRFYVKKKQHTHTEEERFYTSRSV